MRTTDPARSGRRSRGAAAPAGRFGAGVGHDEAAARVLRPQEAHDAPGDGAGLGPAHVVALEEGLLRRVGDEGQLDQAGHHAVGRRAAQDPVVVVARVAEAVLGAGVAVGHPVGLEGRQGLDDLLVDQPGQALRLGRAGRRDRLADLVVGLAPRPRPRLVGGGVVVDRDEGLGVAGPWPPPPGTPSVWR